MDSRAWKMNSTMKSQEEQIDRLETLKGLMDRLCDPDLTLVESRAVRRLLAEFLDQETPGGGPTEGPGMLPHRKAHDGGVERRKPVLRFERPPCGVC